MSYDIQSHYIWGIYFGGHPTHWNTMVVSHREFQHCTTVKTWVLLVHGFEVFRQKLMFLLLLTLRPASGKLKLLYWSMKHWARCLKFSITWLSHHCLRLPSLSNCRPEKKNQNAECVDVALQKQNHPQSQESYTLIRRIASINTSKPIEMDSDS